MPSNKSKPDWKPGQSMPAYRPQPIHDPISSFASSSNSKSRQNTLNRGTANEEEEQELEEEEDEGDYDSEEDEDEDEEGEELTPAMDAAILRTLRLIKSGDKRVYEEGDVLRAQLEETSRQAAQLNLQRHPPFTSSFKSKAKPFSLQQHQHLALLSSHQTFSNPDLQNQQGKYDPEAVYDEDGMKVDLPETLIPLTHVQEERQLREEVTKAFHTAGAKSDAGSKAPKLQQDDEEEEEDEDEDFLVKSNDPKLLADQEASSQAYRSFLLSTGVQGTEAEMKALLGLNGEGSMINLDGVDEGTKERAKGKAGKGGAGHSGQRDAAAMGQEEEDTVKEEEEQRDKAKKTKKPKGKSSRAQEADDDFLMNYILNRGWIETDPSEEQPTTRHKKPYLPPTSIPEPTAVADNDVEMSANEAMDKGEGTSAGAHPWGTLDEEDEFDEIAEEFETAYNFRFEEPGAAEIPSHPRTIPTALRRPDDTRKLARQAKAERKALEKATREEQTRKQKGAKRREIEGVLRGLGVGEDELEATLEELMDGDWDEKGWDKKMRELVDRQEEEDGEEKPDWGDEDGGEYEMDYEEVEEEGDEEEGLPVEPVLEEQEMEVEEDAPLDMDADFISFEAEPKRNKKTKKKKDKGKQKQEEEPKLDIVEREEGASGVETKKKKMKKALEDYKKLDHEDMIGDLPTRFKYTKSAPTDYGLTPTEILLATDAELNAFLGVKHYAPYRNGGLGSAGQGKNKRLYDLKNTLAKRRWGEEVEIDKEGFGKKTFGDGKADQGWSGKRKREGGGGDIEGGEGPKKKRKGKNERKKKGGDGEGGQVAVE